MGISIDEIPRLTEADLAYFEQRRLADDHDGTTSTKDTYWWAAHDKYPHAVRAEFCVDKWYYDYVPFVGY